MLYEKLAERGQITEPGNLKKAGIVGAGMLLLFIFGEEFHLLPAVTAIMGATALLVWIRPNIEEMIEAVDWTTLVFFLSLFIVVGGIQEVGVISFVAEGIGRVVGDNLVLAIFIVTWFSAILSMVVISPHDSGPDPPAVPAVSSIPRVNTPLRLGRPPHGSRSSLKAFGGRGLPKSSSVS